MSVTDAEKTSKLASPEEIAELGKRKHITHYEKDPSPEPTAKPEINPAVSIALPRKYDIESQIAERHQPTTALVERRPTKFTPAVKTKIIQALKLGASYRRAAEYGGVTERTLENWFRRGLMSGPDSEGVNKELYDFQEECQSTRAQGLVSLTSIAWQHAMGDGNVTIKLMEKLYPEDFGARVRHDHAHEHSGTVQHNHSLDYSKFTDEELEQIERLALKGQEEIIDAEIVE